MVILNRESDLENIKRLGKWVYICGRRKTGKTFFVKNFMNYDSYFFVNRDGTLFTESGEKISYETFFELFKEIIGRKKTVIDEMHRLPEEFFDYLHSIGKKGDLIAISSTLWLSKKLLGSGSPLLGLFAVYIMGLVDCCDVLRSLPSRDPIESVKAGIYLREPLLAMDYNPPVEKYLSTYLYGNKLTIREIIGEIFSEEERRLSLIYEGILKAIASGKRKSGEISSFLFSRRLLSKDNPGIIQRHLDILVKIGLIEKIQTYSRGFYYLHSSPLFNLHFYLEEKYGYTETEVPLRFIERVVNEMIPHDVEKFIWDLFASKFGLKKVKIENPEIDIALKRYDKLALVGEVKWKKKISKRDLENAINKLKKFDCRKILVVPDKEKVPMHPEVEILDARDIMNLCLQSGKFQI